MQSNKRKICLKVKKTILQLISFIYSHMNNADLGIHSMFKGLICLWQKDLIY
jgi:hypothetical protein